MSSMSLEEANDYFLDKLHKIKLFKEEFGKFNLSEIKYYKEHDIGAKFDLNDSYFFDYIKDKYDIEYNFTNNMYKAYSLHLSIYDADRFSFYSENIPALSFEPDINKNNVTEVYDFLSKIKNTKFTYLSNEIFNEFINKFLNSINLLKFDFSKAKMPQYIKNRIALI